jgi:toxin-antitoxin system PIN domain toxin
MKLVDSNVWLALALSAHDFHNAAVAWLEKETASRELLFCRSTQQSFLRLLTTDAVLRSFGNPPLTNAEAWVVYSGFLEDPRIALVPEPDGIEHHWQRNATRETASPKLWMDAYLAAFATAGGYGLVTIDRAFEQFKDLEMVLLETTRAS